MKSRTGLADLRRRGRRPPRPFPRHCRTVIVCCLVAVVSMASGWTSQAELEGTWPRFSLIRKSVSKLVNTGTLWAALAVLAGWCTRRARTAWASGVVAAEGTLALHYGLGQLLGRYESGIWSENWHWFVAGLVLCAPLGMVGWLTRGSGRLAVAARLVVPLGALAEPFVVGMLTTPALLPWPERWSSTVCAVVLLASGAAGTARVLVRAAGPTRRLLSPLE